MPLCVVRIDLSQFSATRRNGICPSIQSGGLHHGNGIRKNGINLRNEYVLPNAFSKIGPILSTLMVCQTKLQRSLLVILVQPLLDVPGMINVNKIYILRLYDVKHPPNHEIAVTRHRPACRQTGERLERMAERCIRLTQRI